MSRVAIVGAGVAGLTAARELARQGGCEVVVLEKESRPGGLARTLERGSFRVDYGPHRLHTELPEAQAVYDAVSAEHGVETLRRSRMRLAGVWLRYPPSMIEMGLRMPMRSAGFALSLAAARLRRPGSSGPQTFASTLRGMYGARLYDFFFGPYAKKVWKNDPEGLSPEIVRLRIDSTKGGLKRLVRPRSVARLCYLRGGVETLPRRLATEAERAGARIVAEHAVAGLRGGSKGVCSVVTRGPEGEKTWPADVVLSTAPLPDLIEWTQPLSESTAAREAAGRLAFLRLTLVCLIARTARVSDDTWTYFPGSETRVNRTHEPRNFDASMAPEGRSLLCCEITSRGEDDNWTADEGALVDGVAAELDAAGMIRRADVEDGFVARHPRAYPLYDLDYAAPLTTALDYLRRFDNLVPLGRQGLFNHNNMDHSIVMGLRAATAARTGQPAAAMRAFEAEFRKFRIVD